MSNPCRGEASVFCITYPKDHSTEQRKYLEIMRNTMHGKEKLAVVVQHTAVPSLMECTTLYSISHP
jgi:hypothetical protein